MIKTLVDVSANASCVFTCNRREIFPEYDLFLNFIRSRSDAVLDLKALDGSTSAVGVDGVLRLKKCSLNICTEDSNSPNFCSSVCDKEYLFKIVDRSVLLYPMGFVST